MRYTLIAQVVIIGLSIGIMFVFIRPMFAEIKVTQDKIFQYSNVVAKASQFNARLQELLSIQNSFSASDRSVLENFIPNEIDVVDVMKNIETIFALSEVTISTLAAQELQVPNIDYTLEVYEGELPQEPPSTIYQDFDVTFNGTYEDVKEVLVLAEANATLLEVVKLKLDPVANNDDDAPVAEEGEYAFSITFRAYALAPDYTPATTASPNMNDPLTQP
jgi:hypothetical protein